MLCSELDNFLIMIIYFTFFKSDSTTDCRDLLYITGREIKIEIHFPFSKSVMCKFLMGLYHCWYCRNCTARVYSRPNHLKKKKTNEVKLSAVSCVLSLRKIITQLLQKLVVIHILIIWFWLIYDIHKNDLFVYCVWWLQRDWLRIN